jgi:hypothetical protein
MTHYDHTDAATGMRDDLSRHRGPRFAPLDVVAFILGALLIWGPLAAGALRY